MIVKLPTLIRADVKDRNGVVWPRGVLERLVSRTNNQIAIDLEFIPVVGDVSQEVTAPSQVLGRVHKLELDNGSLGAVVDLYKGAEIPYASIPDYELNTAMDCDVVGGEGSGVVQSTHLVRVSARVREPPKKK